MSRPKSRAAGAGIPPPPRPSLFWPGLLLCCLLVVLPACQPRREVTLAFLGDLNLGRGVEPDPGSLSYLSPWLSAAHLVLGSLESPLGTPPPAPSPGYNLCAPQEGALLLAAWGLDLLSLANNHAADCSAGGLQVTQSALASAGLLGLGPLPSVLEVGGLSLAFLAFEDVSTLLDVEAAASAVQAARQAGSLVIVSVHWGLEYQGAPSPRQVSLAQEFAAAGASVIWGHHPHVLQRAEWIGSTLVLYSLGNALFDQGGLDDTRQSALVSVSIGSGGVTAVEAVPFSIDPPRSRVVAPGEQARQEILDRLDLPGE